MYDETGDEVASQGWCPTVLDTNGDGVVTKPWNEPARGGEQAEHDPALDTRIIAGAYGVITNPVDDAVWIVSDRYPGDLVRLDRGDNPPETCVAELYVVPAEHGYRTRSLDVDRNGVLPLRAASRRVSRASGGAAAPRLPGAGTTTIKRYMRRTKRVGTAVVEVSDPSGNEGLRVWSEGGRWA